MSSTEGQRKLEIPPPRADRPPLRANVFSVLQKANTTLMPLFPYMHPGAMVPTGALLMGGPGKDYGHFFHHNSVDEVIIAFVAKDATLQTGQIYNGGRTHGVNSFLKDQTKAGSFALFTITQRQLDEGPQPESITLMCAGCRKQLFKGEFDGAAPPDALELDHPFQSVAAIPELLRAYNSDAALRTCPDCHRVNEPFPIHAWGWDQYTTRTTLMQQAQKDLLRAGGGARE